jgi:hypothetical protein
MGTPASIGATPEKSTASLLEEANKRIADLEHSNKNATEERDRHRKKLTTYEEQERKAQEAALSEVDKATKRATEAEQKIQHYQQQLVTTRVQLAAQQMGIIDPELAALAISNKLELGEDGLPTNIEKALSELVKAKPYLLAKAEAPATPVTPPATHTTPQQQAPAIPAMNPGRANLTAPGTLPPSKLTLKDVPWSR